MANVESNVEDPQSTAAGEAAPTRRRASRRASAAAGAVSEPAAPAEAAPAEAAEEAPKKRVSRSRKKADASADDAVNTAPAAPAEAAPAEPAEEAPKKRATRSRKKPVEAPAEAGGETAVEAAAPAASDAAAAQADAETAPEAPKRGRRRAKSDAPEAQAADLSAAPAEISDAAPAAPEGAAAEGVAANGAKRADEAETADAEAADKPARSRRARGRGQKEQRPEQSDGGERGASAPEAPAEGETAEDSKPRNQQNGQQNGDRNGANGDRNAKSNEARSSRTRQRDRKRRGQNDDLEPELTEDDVLLPVAGILDVLDNYAFVRTSGYLPGLSDVYVSLGQVKKYGLRRGDAVVGAIKQPREGDGAGRQKYNAIVKIDAVNGKAVDENETRVDIAELTPVYPQQRIRLEAGAGDLTGRAIDLVAPIGFGQRGLLVLRSGAPSTRVLSGIASAVTAAHPAAHLMLVLTDALPEEVTQLQRTVHGEVIAASFDRSSEDQTTIAELAIDRARRLVELGHDVVLLLDSVNRLARAFAQGYHGGRGASETAEEFALIQVKRLLAAARNVENGGSLTVLATVLDKTGVEADKALLREVRGVVNSEIRFGKAAPGLVPAVDLKHSRTLGLESMLGEADAALIARLHADLDDDEAAARLSQRLQGSASNEELLAELRRSGSRS